MELTKNEIEIMEVLWSEQRPLTRTEIVNLSVDKSWKDSSIHILLNSLLKKMLFVRLDMFELVKDLAERLNLPNQENVIMQVY